MYNYTRYLYGYNTYMQPKHIIHNTDYLNILETIYCLKKFKARIQVFLKRII